MEFLSRNFYDTTTMISVNSNTFTAEYLMTRDERFQYVSDGFADDSLTSSITITFDTTQLIDRIAILSTNVKKMNIYHDGVTASAFPLTGPTTTSQFTQNSATALWLPCSSTVACLSITFDLYSTQVAATEKAVGHILLSKKEFTMPRIPSASEYKPIVKAKELRHELSTGGVRTHVIQQKYNLKFKYKYLSDADVDTLAEIWEAHEPKIFVPWPTTTAWDGIAFEANWTGPFDFQTFSDNAVAAGHTGNIILEET